MLLMIDNYDSFTYNIVQSLGELGCEVQVVRNDQITIAGIEALAPQRIVISPGPCFPEEAGISVGVVRHFAGRIPILGVCLGHQAIGYAFGARIVKSKVLMHGKISPILHNEEGLFRGLPNPFQATRYHSLVVDRESLPGELMATAMVSNGEIMGLQHRTLPVWGVQFHPESIMSEQGRELFGNFLALSS
jgi:anthranilate synthase component II